MSGGSTRPFIRAALIDISGNLQVGSRPTPNAVEALQRLRASSIPFRLCSNTSKESTDSVIQKLRKIGFEIASTGEVWTSIGAVRRVLDNMGLKRPYMLLSRSAREELGNMEGIDDASPEQPYDSVIVGLTPPAFDYNTLNTAFRLLIGEHNQGDTKSPPASYSPESPFKPIPLIATHKAKYVETDSPPGRSLGPGPFVTALESAAGVQAHVVGKPTKAFFELVLDDFTSDEMPAKPGVGQEREEKGEKDHPYGRIAVIGDDIEADLGEGAIELGLWRVLVRTGKYRPGDEQRCGVIPPDEVVDNFAAFVHSLLQSQR
ncbi:hypothetical protein BDN72DRAFT_799755 [Pluteus cervinus]|uniref:Uncharacterized protein n=1 Tax=Pluteus cervinus TaxID=181527 RepID=A0ACD3ALN3_9AGAR|nr:hypothetical protein BDN72DRAFT_799755 [Pluteus cervinus]